MTVEDIQQKQIIKKLRSEIVKNIKTNFDYQMTKEKLQDIISLELKDRTQESSIQVRGLWDSWSLWQRLVWFWKIEWGFGDLEHQEYLNTWDNNLQEYTSEKKFWMEWQPKTVMIADVKFIPVRSVEYIKVILK